MEHINEEVHRILKNTEYLFEYQHTYDQIDEIVLDIFKTKIRQNLKEVMSNPDRIKKIYTGYNFNTGRTEDEDMFILKNDRKSHLPVFVLFQSKNDEEERAISYRYKMGEKYSDNDILVIKLNTKHLLQFYQNIRNNPDRIKLFDCKVMDLMAHELEHLMTNAISVETHPDNYELTTFSTEFDKADFDLSIEDRKDISFIVYMLDQDEQAARRTQIATIIKKDRETIHNLALRELKKIVHKSNETPVPLNKNLLIAAVMNVPYIKNISKMKSMFRHIELLKYDYKSDESVKKELLVLGYLLWKFDKFKEYPTDDSSLKELKIIYSYDNVYSYMKYGKSSYEKADIRMLNRINKKCIETIENMLYDYEYKLANEIDKHIKYIFKDELYKYGVSKDELVHVLLKRDMEYSDERIKHLEERYERYKRNGFHKLLPLMEKSTWIEKSLEVGREELERICEEIENDSVGIDYESMSDEEFDNIVNEQLRLLDYNNETNEDYI